MGVFRVYFKPFDRDGNYQSEYIEVTTDVLALGEIKQDLDESKFSVGVFRFGTVNIKLRNDHGRYLDQTSSRSIFEFKRAESKVKITYDINPQEMVVGFFKAGVSGPIPKEETIFEGLITEATATASIDDQVADFDCLGFESTLKQIKTPFGDITNGDSASDVFLNVLDHPPFNELVTVSGSNITPGYDITIDDKSSLENTTSYDVISSQKLLLLSASVLVLEGGEAIVKSRDATASVIYSFYGQASTLGTENVLDVRRLSYGLNKMFNFWSWKDTSLTAENASFVDKFGVSAQEIDSDLITNNTTRQAILDENRDEYGAPKIEMQLICPLNYDTLALKLLDKVDIDYPTEFVAPEGEDLPVWDKATWGEFTWPVGKWSLTLDQTTKFKVLARSIRPKDETMTFYLREV